LSFIEGEFVHPAPWTDEAFPQLGMMLRRLHDATAFFKPAENPVWRDWFGRKLGEGAFVIGHCDTGPWNIVCRSGLPIAFIDWEVAGPVRADVELIQPCWLNAQLYDDDIAERVGLGSATASARQVRVLLEREGFVHKLIMFAIHDAAEQAKEAAVTPETTDAEPLWAIAWRTRSASWMLRHRRTLEAALA